ncbi:MAG: exodeoxyribonuclease VII large subunit [Candidatus Pseudoruminococcus sp.]|uniref:exodeoxyribonuclease VII large subunit n=1 Tax=Candidatus Pseudoruminococcus sp. TaxID=3101048 RepID=UPI002A7C5DA3|nr:exodeoxyribonuclease VII large subunit [Ruminococcus sp.]MDY2782753.1 exodeoxyribonuclease VII large subunit [Candidatus Pseudoruminococcus sp.]
MAVNSVITVSQLNFYIKSLLDESPALREIYITGEISNLTDHYRSGHIYLSLKDDKALVRAVMFAGNARHLRFKPEEGMKVIARGRVSVYEATGQYQLYIEDMQPDGIGALNLAYEQLKKKLSSEGLFSEDIKKPIPAYPTRIGVITSPTGAAVQDILNILGRRYPIAEVVFCPVLVQGENASAQLIDAVERFNKANAADVIIIGRGGGSIEDLWAFNDEKLARTIAESDIPIISAVGHETDFTICDFVADLRAPTPSAAAELATPNMAELLSYFKSVKDSLPAIMQRRIDFEKQELDNLASSKVLLSPEEFINIRKNELDVISADMIKAFKAILSENQREFAALSAKLDALSPLSVLSRGYSIIQNKNKVIKSAEELNIGQNITVKLSDGKAECEVRAITLDEKG